MEPIFDLRAKTVGWRDEDIVFDEEGLPLAFMEDEAVYAAQDGRYLGQFDRGTFRDRLGCVVAFSQPACRCAVLPLPQAIRVPPEALSRTAPGRLRPQTPPVAAKPLLNRSTLDWEGFVAGREAEWPWETRL